jgi:DNA invertase Pin-like site-specific DNA recombinase
MTSKTRVIVYLRCSTAEQADEGLSLDAQQAKAMAYAALYGLDIIQTVRDPGVSAKSYNGLQGTLEHRPGLRAALSALDAGHADGLLLMKLDRLTRSVRDLDEMVERYFAKRFALISVTEQLDTRSASGRMVLGILSAVAQGERETIGERTAAALSLKRSRREHTGGEPNYGWQLDADGTHVVPHPAEQHAITRARMWRVLGLSLRKVGRALEGEGIYARCGKPWHATTVRSLIAAELASAEAA